MNDWIENFHLEIEHIFAEAAAEIALFPAPMNEDGLALLDGCHPLRRSGGANYISYLLPYWLNERLACDPALCRDLAVGNIYAMLHFFLLDDAMDAGEKIKGESLRHSLVLGQLFHLLFERRYYRHFPAGSPVWARYEAYIADWAAAVYDEGKAPPDPFDPRGIARKSAPVKLCAACLLLQAGEEERLPFIEEAVDLALATLQLADDWADWQCDLGEESGSVFLTLARRQLSLDAGVPLEERAVKEAVYRHGCLDRLAELAEDNGRRLKELPEVPAMLAAFHDAVAGGIREDARKAEETTVTFASGGLSYFLTKLKE